MYLKRHMVSSGLAAGRGPGRAAFAVLAGLCAVLILLPARSARAGLGGAAAVVGITGASLDKPLEPGGTSVLLIKAQIISGWHINSDRPLNRDYIPTRVWITPPEGVSVGSVEYPFSEEITLEFAGAEKLSVFTGEIEFRAALRAGPRFAPGKEALATLTIEYQACNDTQCLRPSSVSTTVNLAGAAAKPLGSGAPSESGPRRPEAPGSGLAQTFSTHGYLLGFLAVLLGGLALNLTPCVYPLIGVTITYFGNQGGGRRRLLVLAILYVLGIAAMFSGLGVAVALSGGLFGAALQSPYVLSGIAALLVALAASSFGLFVVQPPQWMARWAGAAHPGYAGSFLMGLGMGVVAAPCIGPIVVGLLLMVEQSRSPAFGFALFFTLALGLGAPYVGLALAAGSIRRLPRSGQWLQWIDQLFGFVLIGLAIYFLDPIVPHHLMTRMLPYYAASAGIFLGFVSSAGRNWRPFLVVRSALGVASAVALIYLLAAHKASRPLEFQPFDASLLADAKARHRPVLLDFSAAWCIPCREMDHSTFVDAAVIREAERFVRLRADLTTQDHKVEATINRFNVRGVPTTVLIDSSGRIRQQTVGYIGPEKMLESLRHVD